MWGFLSACIIFCMYLYILFLWPLSFGNSRLNNSSNLNLLFKVVFSLCPFSLSFSPLGALQLVNEFFNFVSRLFILQNVWSHLWSQQHKCEVCTVSCCVHSSEGALYEVCFSAKSTTFYQLQMPTHTAAGDWFCLTSVCVLVVLLRGKPCACLSCRTPRDVFRSVLKITVSCKPGLFHCKCVMCYSWLCGNTDSFWDQGSSLHSFSWWIPWLGVCSW